jgi:hypothetical protein
MMQILSMSTELNNSEDNIQINDSLFKPSP